jgi:molybdopterin/thiamine biosynthesis adenylyltransferase
MQLNQTTLYVVGCGGTGGRLLDLLADYFAFSHNYPNRIVLVDDDKIEERNAERQVFDRLDAGRYKVEVLKDRFITKSGFGRVEALPVKWTPETLPHDLGKMSEAGASISLFICIDNARGRNALWSYIVGYYDSVKREYEKAEVAYKGNFLIVDGGNGTYDGQVTTCLRVRYENFDCILGQDPRVLFENVRNADPRITGCAAAEGDDVAQTVMANMQVATLMFSEFVSAITTHKFQPLIKFDLQQRRMLPVGAMCDLGAEYTAFITEKTAALEAAANTQIVETAEATTETVIEVTV